MLTQLHQLLQNHLRDLFHQVAPASRLGRFWLRLRKLVYLTARKFQADETLERASSLAFAATLSLIPLTVLAFLMFHDFFNFAARVEEYIKLNVISLADETSREQLQALVDEIVTTMKSPIRNSGAAVTPFAWIGLFLAGLSLFRSTERNLSDVWLVSVTRPLIQKLAIFWLMFTAVPFLLALPFILSEYLQLQKDGWFTGIASSLIMPTSLSFFGFLALFAILPNTKVRIESAGLGALFAAAVWVLGTQLFSFYVKNIANQSIYGALGVLPFGLIWLYYSWGVVLVGSQLSYCLQNFSMLEREVRLSSQLEMGNAVVALALLESAYRAFQNEAEREDLLEFSERLGVSYQSVASIAEALRASDFLVLDEDSFFPKRSPGSVTLQQVVAVFPGELRFAISKEADELNTPLFEYLNTLGQKAEHSLTSQTFADLVSHSEAVAYSSP